MTRDEIRDAFDFYNIPTLNLFVDFQLQYGGYCPEVEEMTFGIVSPLDDDDDQHHPEEINGLVRVDFSVDCLVQIGFYIDETGLIYYDHLPVAESFESYLRHRCYVDSVLDERWKRITHDRRDGKPFRKLLERQSTSRIEEASDKFLEVSRNEGMMLIERGEHYSELFLLPEVFYGK